MPDQQLYVHALFPLLAYTIACFGIFQGWACIARFRAAGRTGSGWAWLAAAALTIGGSIWGMHMLAVLGLGVEDLTIRHNMGLTALSALVSVGSTVIALLVLATGRDRTALLTSGTLMTLGLIGAHLTAFAALNAPAQLQVSISSTVLSVILLAAGVTFTLCLTLTVTSRLVAVTGALLAAASLCAAQYAAFSGFTATQVTQLSDHASAGVRGPDLYPVLAAVLLTLICTVAFNLYVTPTQDVDQGVLPVLAPPASDVLPASVIDRVNEGSNNEPVLVSAYDEDVMASGRVLHVAG
ncbi:MHYT domain-containing protein [Streptomyces fructofermentans]|uniref:MHYT domain-containing protein n=1 Tax=Streptomyces fructofermentans TaxID=152141 RepID=UPI0033CADA45